MSYGLKKQISKLNPKMGFFGGPNKALANMGLKRPKLVSFWEGEQNVKEKEKGEKKRKKMEGQDQGQQGMELWIFGMETTLGMDFVWITWNFKVLYG